MSAALRWGGTAARLVLAGVFALAGWSKVFDLAASGRAVNAYRLMALRPRQDHRRRAAVH